MANVTVIGAQWGDEGKGKIVDWLASRADAVVRFQGGHNAGHTLVIDGKVFKLNLLPSGVVRGGKLSIIGNGVVVDPWHLLNEIASIGQSGVHLGPDDLILADNAVLILPWHKDIDAAREEAAAGAQIGTTRRGIGPAYEDKVGRRAIRVADLADRERYLNARTTLRTLVELGVIPVINENDTVATSEIRYGAKGTAQAKLLRTAMPKGTTLFAVDRHLFLEACERAWPTADTHLVSDDTSLQRGRAVSRLHDAADHFSGAA